MKKTNSTFLIPLKDTSVNSIQNGLRELLDTITPSCKEFVTNPASGASEQCPFSQEILAQLTEEKRQEILKNFTVKRIPKIIAVNDLVFPAYVKKVAGAAKELDYYVVAAQKDMEKKVIAEAITIKPIKGIFRFLRLVNFSGFGERRFFTMGAVACHAPCKLSEEKTARPIQNIFKVNSCGECPHHAKNGATGDNKCNYCEFSVCAIIGEIDGEPTLVGPLIYETVGQFGYSFRAKTSYKLAPKTGMPLPVVAIKEIKTETKRGRKEVLFTDVSSEKIELDASMAAGIEWASMAFHQLYLNKMGKVAEAAPEEQEEETPEVDNPDIE